MTRSRFGLLGICAVIFSAMVFSATTAQATVGAQWLLAKSNGELITFLPATVELEKETTFVLHTTINKGVVSLLIKCEKIKAINAKLLANGSIGEKAGTVANSSIEFSKCKTFFSEIVSIACEPHAKGKEPGTIVTQPGHGLIVLNGLGEERTLLLPDSGNTVAFIEASEECAFGIKSPLAGTAVLRDCEGLFLKHLLKHLAEVYNSESRLFFIKEENIAIILGSAWAFLGGEHKDLLFSGDPA